MEGIHAKRIEIGEPVMKPLASMIRLDQTLEIESRLRNLVNLRASQINGCAFCIDMQWHVRDSVWDRAVAAFDEKELINLMFAITSINSWNRLAIAVRLEPGHYEPGTLAQAA